MSLVARFFILLPVNISAEHCLALSFIIPIYIYKGPMNVGHYSSTRGTVKTAATEFQSVFHSERDWIRASS